MNRLMTVWLGALVLTVVCLAVLLVPRGESQPALQGTSLQAQVAPNFVLRDQFGQTISLHALRGRPVVVTFLEALCTETCPLVAAKIHDAVTAVQRSGGNPAVIAISTDPEKDTPAAIRSFSKKFQLYHQWHYLNGMRSQLQATWNAYAVYVPPKNAPPILRDGHTSATYLIDRNGREQILMGGDPDYASLLQDLQILSGVPVHAFSRIAAPFVGHPAPNFQLSSLDGQQVNLRQWQHRPVIVNFWATWCHPCQREIPLLSSWYRQYRNKRLLVIGVDHQEDASTVRSYVASHHVPYPVLLDPNGSASSIFDVHLLPVSYLIDPDGTIRALQYGGVDANFLHTEVLPVLLPSQ